MPLSYAITSISQFTLKPLIHKQNFVGPNGTRLESLNQGIAYFSFVEKTWLGVEKTSQKVIRFLSKDWSSTDGEYSAHPMSR